MPRRSAVLLVLLLVAGACSNAPVDQTAPEVSPSTESTSQTSSSETVPTGPTAPLYNQILLNTPENAALSLISAYEDGDYVRAWLIFDVGAQQQFTRSITTAKFSEIRSAVMAAPWDPDGSSEHPSHNDVDLIARSFQDAAATGALHVDFSGATVEAINSAPEDQAQPEQRVVTIRLPDSSKVELAMALSPSQKWRVSQVALDDVGFDDSERVFRDASCGASRVRVYEGVVCPLDSDGSQAALQAEVDRFREATANLSNAEALVAASQLQALVDGWPSTSDDTLCAIAQANLVQPELIGDDAIRERAETLIAEICPGSIELFDAPPLTEPASSTIGQNTAYAQLNLSTPEASVETFAELFANRAFFVLFFALDGPAQVAAADSVNLLELTGIVDRRVLDTWELGAGEHDGGSPVNLFNEFMNEASDEGLHIIDLSQEVEVLTVRPTEALGLDGESVNAQIVEATISESPVFFFVVESKSGRWRVRQVATSVDALTPSNDGLLFID